MNTDDLFSQIAGKSSNEFKSNLLKRIAHEIFHLYNARDYWVRQKTRFGITLGTEVIENRFGFHRNVLLDTEYGLLERPIGMRLEEALTETLAREWYFQYFPAPDENFRGSYIPEHALLSTILQVLSKDKHVSHSEILQSMVKTKYLPSSHSPSDPNPEDTLNYLLLDEDNEGSRPFFVTIAGTLSDVEYDWGRKFFPLTNAYIALQTTGICRDFTLEERTVKIQDVGAAIKCMPLPQVMKQQALEQIGFIELFPR